MLISKPGFLNYFFLVQGGFENSSIALNIPLSIGFFRERHLRLDCSKTKFQKVYYTIYFCPSYFQISESVVHIFEIFYVCWTTCLFSLLIDNGFLRKSNAVTFLSAPSCFFGQCQLWLGSVSPDGCFTCGLFYIPFRGLSIRCVKATLSDWSLGTSLSFYGAFSVFSLPLCRYKMIDFPILRKFTGRNLLIFLVLLSN